MSMVCPECHRAYEQRWQCPQCQATLRFQIERVPFKGAAGWPGSGLGRLFLGLVLSQGFFHAMRLLARGGLSLAVGASSQEFWTNWDGLLALHTMQGIAVFIAAMVVSASQISGAYQGAMVGVWSGLLFVTARYITKQDTLPISEIAEAVLNLSVGLIGGILGSYLWKPAVRPQTALDAPKPKSAVRERVQEYYHGPIGLLRVGLGVALAVAGVVWASVLRELIVDFSEGRLQISSHLQAELLTWEISALAMLAGSALAGATKNNGLKQGLFVGVGTATVLVGLRLASPQITLPLILITMLSALCLGVAGGWFGSQLLPPIANPARGKRRGLRSPTLSSN